MTRSAAAAAAAVLGLAALVSCRGAEPTPAAAMPLRFHREYVTVEPSQGRTRVVGLYYFRNESDEPLVTAIRYPFPVDRNHVMPFRIRVWEQKGETLQPLGFVHTSSSVTWRMRFGPGEQKTVRVEYVQEIKRNHAIYIVTTTKEWGKPIELAEFEFRVPAHLEDVRLSFTPDRVEVSGDTVVYYVRKTDFLPDSDLTLTWR